MAAPFRFAVQERSFPVPTGSPSQTVDWLPDYYGYGWVAFASSRSLVISITKSPTRQDEADLGICQVIDAPHDAPAAHITCVRWSPPFALLAASCEHLLWIYTPHPYDQASSSDFPQGWVLSHKLEHTFKVWSFAWTELGDGVLSVGTKVIMWRQNETGWYPLWTSHVTHPQSFAAATLSAKGLAATAEGNILPSSMEDSNAQGDEYHRIVTKGKATVWWWEDSLGLLESELIHPQEVLFLQWRPSKGPFTLQEAFRPVLMTLCKDGAVRLWLEIDSGRARLDKALGKDVSAKHLKPAYFVSAVIEAEQCLHGILGVDVFVSWPLECRLKDSGGVIAGSSYGANTISKRETVGSCEWLLGIGPEGSIYLWSVFCLDDIYPPRCPRVFLWKQADGVLPFPALSTGNKMRQVLIKVVSQRLGNGLTDPPSTLDLFYTSELTLFQWSCIWPPVTAICGDLSKETVISEAIGSGIVPGKARKDSWGMVTECYISNGHSHDIISIAIHPITYTGLVATLDSQGCVFLWCTSLLMNRKLSLCVSVWKPSGQLAVSLESKNLTWLPAVFAEGQTVLLLAHAGLVHCYLVSKGLKTTFSSLPLEVKLLSRFNLCVDNPEEGLDSIWALPLNSQSRDFLIIGLGQARDEVVSCNLEIVVRDQGSDQVNNLTNVTVSVSSSIRLQMFESVSCVAIAPTSFLPFTQTLAGSLAFEPLAFSRPYDIITGSNDGMVRLWKKEVQDVDTIDDVWLCVGMLKVCSAPVAMIAVGCSGFKIATWGPAPLEVYGEGLLIWDIEGLTDGAIFNLSGRVSSAGCPTSVQWLDLCSGGSLLGVMTQSEVQVYAESRAYKKSLFTDKQNSGQQISVQSSWFLLASVPLFSNASCFTWGSKGSLLVPLKEHLLVYGPWIFPDNMAKKPNQVDLKCLLESQWDQTWSLLKAGQALSSPLPMHHPMSIFYHLYTGNHQRARVCLLYLQQNLSGRSFYMEDKAPCGLLQIYSPKQLLEIIQMESNAEKTINSKQVTSLSWSSGFDRDFEDSTSSFSRMCLAGDECDRGAAHQDNEISTMLNLEKLEFCLKKFSHVLDLAEDQRMQLLTIADVLVQMDTESKALEYRSLDSFGQRFWLAVQLSYSDQCRKNGKIVCIEALNLETKAMAWALQSDCKDTLLDVCMRGELSWPAMRALGVGLWLTDASQLRTRIEKLARAQYLMEKNPRHCALLYLALRRKTVLMGLFKLSKDDKDRVLYEFLARDFLVERNRAAALKNAYVLLGKHQHDLAAAFFLLGDDLSSAASVCAKNLGDLQLAFIICRLIEGINGPTEQRLIKEYALPNAQNEGDYWLASLFQWLLGDHFKAIEELTGRLAISETMPGSEQENSFSAISSDRIRGAFVDPQVGLFCLHLASKPVVQSGFSAASAVILCKWFTLKTSAVLERLGLPLEALEYLSSAKDSFWLKPQSRNKNVVVASVIAYKTRLALQYQAQFVQAHPCWWFEQHTKLGYLRSSLLGVNSTQRHFFETAAESTGNLLQSLYLLENRFAIDTKHVTAKLAGLAHDQNMLYLQCVFTRGTTDESQSTKDTLFVPCFKFFDQSVKFFGDKWFKAIDPLGLCSFQPFISTTGSCARRDAGECSPLDATETFLLAVDLWLLLGLHRENMDVNVEIALLILVLYSAAAWAKCHWNAIGFVLKLIKSPAAALCVSLSDIEAAFKVYLGSNDIASSMEFCKVTPHVCSDLGQMTEFEVWHVLGLAFWDAFLGWAKQQLKNVSSGRSDKASSASAAPFDLQSHEHPLKALQCVSSFFQRKLVFYLNSTMVATSLNSWLLHNHNVKESILSGTLGHTSSVPSVSVNIDISHPTPLTPSPSTNSLADEVCKELLVPDRIRSALELGGAKLTTSGGWKGAPDSLKSPWKNLSKPVKKNDFIESAPHDREGVTTEKLIGSVMPNGNSELAARSAALERTTLSIQYKNGEEIFNSNGDLLEAVCVNSCCPEQVVVSSSRKGLLYFDLNTSKSFSIMESNLWSQAEWPRNGWANSESTPIPTFVSPGVGLKSREGPSLGLGGATVGLGMLTNVGKESSFKGPGVGIPGYGGVGAWGLGWEEWEDFDGVIDPLATMENVNTQAMDSHPLRPLFLVGSRNTHVYLWEFGKSSATATYGILPAANVPPPYAIASISSVKFDHSGHRFATSAIDGTVCTWQLEVGGRSNVRPTDSCLCFDRHATDVAYVGGSGGIIAATGASQNDLNLVFWDTLAPSTTSQASVFCHEGGARCLEMFDHDVGGGSISSLIVTCGKGGDIAVHDFRYIATGKTKRAKYVKKEHGALHDDQSSRKQQDGELNVNGSVWYIAKAHSGSISCVSAVPGTSLFFTGSKDGDVKLWDANKCELVNHWHKLHDKHMFLQHNARGFGAVVQEFRGFGGVFQAAVTDIQPVSLGFLTCGGDGFLRLFRYQDS